MVGGEWEGVVELQDEDERMIVPRGIVRVYGDGLGGCVAGYPGEFFVEVNQLDLPHPPQPENCRDIEVIVSPRMDLLLPVQMGHRDEPEPFFAEITFLATPPESSSFLYQVSFCCAFASPYQLLLSVPGTSIHQTIQLVVRAGEQF